MSVTLREKLIDIATETGLLEAVEAKDITVMSAFLDACEEQIKGLDSYQKDALQTAIYPKEFTLTYPALGLAGESGEVLDKVKKLIRDKGYKEGGDVSDYDAQDIALELGDVLWYVSVLADILGYPLSKIAEMNTYKLGIRKEKGLLGGSGDHRQDEPVVGRLACDECEEECEDCDDCETPSWVRLVSWIVLFAVLIGFWFFVVKTFVWIFA